ncbi:MAG TPA: response regulator [Polyangiaceae bacterium]|jgi:CheY-like chemotaxis protein|nr:response regulator [Polyangiaceae bacterium]
MSGSPAVELLIVEDSPSDLEMTLRALKRAKLAHRVEVARDGAEALEFLFAQGRFSERSIEDVPRVVFLDLKLPKVDGLEVLQRMKADPRTRSIPVVVLTSSSERKDVVECYNLGVNSYIVKPVNFERFSEAISQLGTYWLSLNNPSLPDSS